MTDGRLEVESKSQECLVIIKREVTSNNLPKRRVLSSTHGVVGGRRLATASYPIWWCKNYYALTKEKRLFNFCEKIRFFNDSNITAFFVILNGFLNFRAISAI